MKKVDASNLPLVAAGDVHMHVRARRILQDAVTAIRIGVPVDNAGFALYSNGERHLRSLAVLAHAYPPDLLEESVRIANTIHFHWMNFATNTPTNWYRLR